MSVNLTEKEFSQHLGTRFRVKLDPKEVELELVEVEGYVSKPNEQKGLERFSVFFGGPGDVFLRQGIYRMEHERMGEFEIFIVPIRQEQNGFRYEAVFNYSK